MIAMYGAITIMYKTRKIGPEGVGKGFTRPIDSVGTSD